MAIFQQVDCSGTITTGGTAQTLCPLPTSGFSVFNPDTGDLWINSNGTAVINGSGSLKVSSGSLYESPPDVKPDGAISIIGATTGQKFTAKRW